MKNPWSIDPESLAGIPGISPSPTIGGGSTSTHPVLISALVGSLGGMLGVIAVVLILFVLGMVFGEAFFGTEDFGEGLGILLGLYCAVMFPIGGGIAGAIPGAILGWLRASRDEPVNAPGSALAGALTIFLLTVAAFAALFLFVPV